MASETDNNHELIDASAVGRAYGVHEDTVWHWQRSGRIPAPVVRRHRYTRWLRSDIDQAIRLMADAERKEQAS